MSMIRSMRRGIARSRMQRRGIRKINKPRKHSFFADNWREWSRPTKTS